MSARAPRSRAITSPDDASEGEFDFTGEIARVPFDLTGTGAR